MTGLYKSFVDKLQTSPEFLDEYQGNISYQLSLALQELKTGEIDQSQKVKGLDQLNHLALCIVLKSLVNPVIDEIKSNDLLRSCDPEKVITSSYLYRILNDPMRTKGFEQEDLEYIRKSLDEVNWFLTPEAMESLGIERIK